MSRTTLPTTLTNPLRALALLALLSACEEPGSAQIDADGDGYGSATTGGTDCDDADPDVSPREEERIYDGLDNDCDPATRDDDLDEDGFGLAFDCDDQDPLTYQGASDRVGDALDQDCDGLDGTDGDGDGVASSLSGGTDCEDDDPSVFPGATEICGDGAVNDCDASEEDALQDCAWPAEIQLGAWEERKILGEQADGGAGAAVSLRGDLDGDGLADLLVGAPGFDGILGDEGAVYVALSSEGAPDSLGQASSRVLGAAVSDGIGRDLATGADLDGDGLDDLAIGSASDGEDGATYVFFGPAAEIGSLSEGLRVVSPTEGATSQGRVVELIDDLDGDGLAELLICRIASENGNNYSVVEIWSGAELAAGTASAPWATISGPSGDTSFGASLAAGDVDGDGLPDLLIGQSYEDSAGEDAGAAWLFLAPRAGSWSTLDASAVFYGEGKGDHAGSTLAIGGDADGDGLPDLLIGAPYADQDGDDRGAAYLITAPAAGTWLLADADVIFRGERADAKAGRALAMGDLNGDGLADVVMGSSRERLERSSVQVYFSPSQGYGINGANADVLLYQEHEDDYAGDSLSTGDLNGDGIDDLAIGAPSYADDASDAGAVYLLAGSGI